MITNKGTLTYTTETMRNAHVNANENYNAKPITILPHVWLRCSCKREHVVSFHALILHDDEDDDDHHLGMPSRLISSPWLLVSPSSPLSTHIFLPVAVY